MDSQCLSNEEHVIICTQKIIKSLDLEAGDITIAVKGFSTAKEYPQFKFSVVVSSKDKDELTMFAKVTELGHNEWNNIQLKPYEKERIFYVYLMNVYRELEDKYRVSKEHKLKVPLCYGAEPAPERDILILQDLWCVGCEPPDRLQPVEWPYAASAITELAKLHALSIAFQNEYPGEFNRISTHLPRGKIEKNEESSDLFETFKFFALKVVRDENKEKLERFLGRHDLTSFNNMLKPLNRKVIVHSHFWPKNMMHRILEDGTVEVIPIDFSNIQVGSPATDLLHFIFTATDDAFREKHYNQLIQHYLTELHRATARLGVDMTHKYSDRDLEREMTQKLPYGLLSAVMYLPVLALDDRPDLDRGLQRDDPTRAAAAAEMYSRRLNEVVDAYANTDVLENQPSTSWNLLSLFEKISTSTYSIFFNSDKKKDE